jgi:ketosteroid isomerase-like protein
VVGGLNFLQAFGRGELDECAKFLHPEVTWHPTPKMVDHEMIRGRDAVKYALEAIRDRYSELEVEPEDGRQVGDHMLLITVFRGKNAFHGSEQKERACWVVTMRDELWSRVINYPNPAWSRVGFEEILRAAKTGEDLEPPPDPLGGDEPAAPDPLQSGTDPHRGVTLHVDVEQATTPAEQATPAPPPGSAGGGIVDLTFEEAEALAKWLVKPAQDGSAAIDDSTVRPALMKLRAAVEREQAVRNVRRELEQAGIQTQHLTDQQVVQLGRRISAATAPAIKPE